MCSFFLARKYVIFGHVIVQFNFFKNSPIRYYVMNELDGHYLQANIKRSLTYILHCNF